MNDIASTSSFRRKRNYRLVHRDVQSCEYGTQSQADKMIRDRIVFTYGDASVREKLIGTENLTLEKAIEICRAAEAIRDRMKTMSDVCLLYTSPSPRD